MEIAVCIATYQRKAGLRTLLESLSEQKGLPAGSFGIVVVDNDPDGSARCLVDEFPSSEPVLEYVVEPEPGIPAARNRGIAVARANGASIVAFIDDDEFATPYWLSTMYYRMKVTGTSAVSGPVEPLFPEGAPHWARETRLYHRATFPDGAPLNYASTANSMLRLDAIAGNLQPFNPEFRFTGGSDTYLYQSLRLGGKSIIWEPAALVYETVPSSRLSMRWLIARSYRQGITLARCDRLLLNGRWRLAFRASRGLAQIPAGLARCAIGMIKKDVSWRNGLVRVARGVGMLAGLSGRTYDEYMRGASKQRQDAN